MTASQEELEALQCTIAEALLAELAAKRGKVSASTLSVVRQFLRDNGIVNKPSRKRSEPNRILAALTAFVPRA